MPRPSKKRSKTKPKPRPKQKRKGKGKKSFSFIGMIFGFVKAMTLMGVLCAIAFFSFYFIRSLSFDMEEVKDMPQRTTVLDRNGQSLGKIHGENRTVVPFDDISPNFLMSIIAREDVRFYEHGGIDFRGLARATLRNIKDRSMTQGASTITMQLSRNTFDLSNGDEWYHELDRKFLEIFVTKRIESNYEKTEILEHYCNRIFWGHSMLGIEAASQAYLQKPAKNLTLSEGAMLAGIVRGPNAFSPFRSIKLATRERDTVLERLVYYGYITEAEADVARAEPLRIRPKKSQGRRESYAMEAISNELSYHLVKKNIKLGGLTIYTTIDKGLQEVAEASVNTRLSKVEQLPGYKHQTRAQFQKSGSKAAPAYIQGALVCIDNDSGGIVATVGGRSATESRFNRATYARRQLGSLFKPFVFQTAFSKGLRPSTIIDDSALKNGEVDYAADNWKPRNSDGKYLGLIEAQEALLRSRNTSSVRVGDYATLQSVQEAAEIAGFELFQWEKQQQNKTPNNAAVYLGAWEASPEEVARAYSIFPNLGHYKHPYVITKIIDRNGKVVFDRSKTGGVVIAEDAVSQGATYEVSKILEQINISGTASGVRNTYGFTVPSAGKTGTTDDYKDAWYAGYTSSLTCAVWVGLDKPKKTINGGYGSRLAMPIWTDVMKAASKKKEFKALSLKRQINTTKVMMCRRSARRANRLCQHYGDAYEDEIPNDLYHTINTPCTIHLSDEKIVQQSQPAKKERSVTKSIGGFFNRLLGKKEKQSQPVSPPRAVIVDEPEVLVKPQTKPKPIPRAIIIEENTRKAPPKRAVLVEPVITQPKRAVVVEPVVPRATVVEEPKRVEPPRAIIID